MGWLNAISTANRETRQVESDNRKRETEIRNLHRMRQQDSDAAVERTRQASAKAAAASGMPDFVPMDEGSGFSPYATPAAAAPAPQAPAAPATTFTQDQIRAGQESLHRMRNTQRDVMPNQSAAETSRLSRYAPPRSAGKLASSGYDASSVGSAISAAMPQRNASDRVSQMRRREELARLNPSAGSTTNQSEAESARMMRSGTPGAAPAAAPTGDKAAFIQQYAGAAQRAGARLGVDPRVLLSQWGLETGWGKSVVPGTNNLGNIKDFSGSGVSAKDNMTGSTDRYRQFGSVDEFADHYAGLVERKYPGAKGAGADMGKFASAMQAGGYAEDPQYVAKLQQTYAGVGRSSPTPASTSQGVAVQTADNSVTATQAAAQANAGAAAPGLPTQQAALPADAVGGRGAGDNQDMRILQMQMAELRARMPHAKTAEDAFALRSQMEQVVAKAQGIQIRNTAAAALEDDKALTSLARSASAPFAQTEQGFVLVRPDGQGNWSPASRPVDRATMVTYLVGVLTGSGAAQAAEQRKTDAELNKALLVEREKGLNAMRTAAAKHQFNLQMELAKHQLTEDDVMGFETNQTTGQERVRTRRGVFDLVPGPDLGQGMRGATVMRPVAVQ